MHCLMGQDSQLLIMRSLRKLGRVDEYQEVHMTVLFYHFPRKSLKVGHLFRESQCLIDRHYHCISCQVVSEARQCAVFHSSLLR